VAVSAEDPRQEVVHRVVGEEVVLRAAIAKLLNKLNRSCTCTNCQLVCHDGTSGKPMESAQRNLDLMENVNEVESDTTR